VNGLPGKVQRLIKQTPGTRVPGVDVYMPGSVLLSHGETPHYHR
ncbi:uncharacterized protein METZ01_LOCUS315363, partial [marine metagenome]